MGTWSESETGFGRFPEVRATTPGDSPLCTPAAQAVLPRSRSAGGRAFTLVEMLIALCILGLLAAISVPFYGKCTAKVRRTDARAQLAVIQQGQEMYRLRHGVYAGQDERFSISGWRETAGRYSFSIPAATDSTFTAQASGRSSGDGPGDIWTIDQDGILTNKTAGWPGRAGLQRVP